jgi:hypothetical protein
MNVQCIAMALPSLLISVHVFSVKTVSTISMYTSVMGIVHFFLLLSVGICVI